MENDESILSNLNNKPSLNEAEELNKEELVAEVESQKCTNLIHSNFATEEAAVVVEKAVEGGGGSLESVGIESEKELILNDDNLSDDGVIGGNDQVAVEENLSASVTAEVVEQVPENVKVELRHSVVIEENVNTEMDMDIRAENVVGNEESVVDKVDDPQADSAERITTDDDTRDGVTQEKMKIDIGAGFSTRMGDGSESERASTSCDPIVDSETVVVAKVENDAAKEVVMDENLVDVFGKEKEKQVELAGSDVFKCEKDEVKGEVVENDELKDNKLDAGNEVGINAEECRDSTSCDPIIDNEAVVVAKVENDAVKEAAMDENLVDVFGKEKEKQVELAGSDVSQCEKDEVKGEVAENDESKAMVEGNSSFGDNKLDVRNEVGMTAEECRDSTSCDPIVDNEAMVVMKVENDAVKEAAMDENLVDVIGKEKQKQVELAESDIYQCEKDEVKGEEAENDELKDMMEGNSSFGDNKLATGYEVGMNVEECRDSKEVDSESTVSESLADKSGKGDEVEGKEEGGPGDIVLDTEADTLDIKKDEEPEATGHLDAPPTQDEEMATEEEANADTETDMVESGKTGGGKRKRGKNRSPASPKATLKAQKTMEDDVCFVCYDGGALVLCDHRGCPKAYHPYCVNKEDTFFHGKRRWKCGRHMCSVCEKGSFYMCYTCPFSLCKGCTKDAVISCVRGKNGFCETCMKTVKLIESNTQGVNNVQVDFNEKGSYEHLFRDYFIELKSKLSLSSAEIAEAKNPCKGPHTSAGKDDKSRSRMKEDLDMKLDSPEPPSEATNDAKLDVENFNESKEATKPRRKRVKKRLKTHGKGQSSSDAAESISGEEGPVDTEWASKELLEFVMHMKSGDRSALCEFDVQALLLEYIRRNNLRDPRQKSRIICDSRLQSLFGKPRVGHFEMLKLLESHFFVKEDLHAGDVQGSVVDTNSEQLEVDGNADTLKGTKEKKRKSRRKGDKRGPQSNLDDYAAIDMHNIGVIYLRRKLMEDLLADSESFEEKVAGTFVRIRIISSVPKQDIYRLVQVVGTRNAAESYKVGKRTTNIMVEILNLNKTEVIPIDTISNQDFTEDECKRLRQSIKCGLINRLTVADILDKATDLQTAKVNDWLETEVVRLSHLRDRASEKGRKKELRECVEKLQLLKTPEELQRRLDEIPEIHADPKMDPAYESEEDVIDVDESRQDVNTKIRGQGSRGGRGQISPGSDTLSKDPFSGGSKYMSKNWELDRSLSSKNLLNKGGDNTSHFGEVQGESSWNQVRDRTSPESSNFGNLKSTVGSGSIGWNNHDVPNSESLNSSAAKLSPSIAKAAGSTKINESEKTWHYEDPSGKCQGPFSIVQLRKWNNTGYFPAGLRVWRTNEKQEDSIPLTDALSGKFLKESTAAANVLPSSLSANLTNIMASVEHARVHQDGEQLRPDQDASGYLPSHNVTPVGQAASSVEHPKFSTERWSRSESSSLPSPTPIRNNAGFTREAGSPSSATSHFGRNSALPSPTAVALENQGRSSTPTAGLRSGETLRASENEPISTGSGGVQVGLLPVSNTSQNSETVINSEARVMQVHGSVAAAQDSFVPQTVSNQNPITGTPGWGSTPSQTVNTNAARPVQSQIQAYGQWGNIPNAGYTHPGNFSQGNQPNMQYSALPNTSWAVGTPENNPTPAPAPIPENQNPNFGWGVMQGNQNTVWVGAPPTNANVHWGAAPIHAPPPANQNMGWTMPQGNLGAVGAAVQGQLPAGANSSWTSGTKNPPVQGLPPAGNIHQSWVAQTGNTPSNVHMPASGSGWSTAPGNLGAPVPGLVPGNANQGLNMRPENQGPWGTDQIHSASTFSSQRDQGSYGGDSGYGGSRSNNQPSFPVGGAGGPTRHMTRHQMLCPYNRGGHCIRGAACDYLHS